MDGFSASVRQKPTRQGFTPSTSAKVFLEPAGEFAELFGLAADDEVCVRDRIQRADGKPVQLAVSRLPRNITRDTVLEEVDTGHGGAYARLEELGFELTQFEEFVSARPATALEQATLDMGAGVVLCVRRVAWSGDRVVEINDMTMVADRYELAYHFPAE